MIRGSDFLTHAETIGTEIEAAFRIVMELQERNLLKVRIDKNGKEPLIMWELKCTEDTENDHFAVAEKEETTMDDGTMTNIYVNQIRSLSSIIKELNDVIAGFKDDIQSLRTENDLLRAKLERKEKA